MLVHTRPPSVVRSSERQLVVPHGAVPSTHPTWTDTKVTDFAVNPGGIGPTGRGGPGVGSGVPVGNAGVGPDGVDTTVSVAWGLPLGVLDCGDDEQAASKPTTANAPSNVLISSVIRADWPESVARNKPSVPQGPLGLWPSRKVYGEPSPTRTDSGSTTEESWAKTIRRGSKSCRRSIQARIDGSPSRVPSRCASAAHSSAA
jgi:hypothetical protein